MNTPPPLHIVLLFAILLPTALAGQVREIPKGERLPDDRGIERASLDAAMLGRQHVAGNVHVLAGGGGNSAAMVGPDGILLVDVNYSPMSQKIVTALRQISSAPIRFVINTHAGGDHSEGNANFAKMGALIFAHDNVRASLSRQPSGQPGTMQPSAPGLPTVTFSGPITFYMNGEQISVIPVKPSHSDGDSLIYFRGSDVIAMGDTYIASYPPISVADGGTTQAFIDIWNMTIDLIGPNTKIIPGHGQLGTKSDLVGLRDATVVIRNRTQQMVRQGMTLEQIKAANPTREFDARFSFEAVRGRPGGRFTTDGWLGIMYDEARQGR
jgi:cyclase